MTARPEATGIPALPPPDPEALAHSRKLCEFLQDEIRRAGGRISFRRYMEAVLHEPGLGYYSAGTTKLGAGGDYVTAPEISPVFSMCLARQCAQILQRTGGVILELGAGSGIMAADMLAELDRLGSLPAQYLVLETSADLRERQRQLLAQSVPGHADRIRWLDALPAEPLRGVIVANEVVDALPVHRIAIDDDGILELGVRDTEQGFDWAPAPVDSGLKERLSAVLEGLPEALPPGYVTELNPDLEVWVAGLADILESGALLCLDYGYPRSEYYHPRRIAGTLRCFYRHRVHGDPFLYPGLQDITASVDFSSLATAGARAGLELCGYTTQARFLMGCGIESLLDAGTNARERLELSRQVGQLMLPGEMGEHIKVICLGRELAGPLDGFAPVDHRHRL